MLDNLKKIFPNRAIPTIFGEEDSYLQQVAYLAYRLQEVIDEVNRISSGSLPVVTSVDNGKILRVEDGAWETSTDLAAAEAQLNSLIGSYQDLNIDVTVLQNQMDAIYDDIQTLGTTLASIVTGDVEEG